ncbi:MAG: cytochrome c, partial [Actinomycetia bacterium]|nr:cytochrome c [Actinomycetes bacterium]
MMVAAVLAADYRAIGVTVAVLVLVAFVGLFIRNVMVSRAELGSEIELAPNRGPLPTDEELEGTKLDQSLTFALVMLAILAVALPFYWIAEPGRQEGAIDVYNSSFESQGENLYNTGAQCVNCHAAGGVGGSTTYVLQDGDGQFIANANWQAPSLNNVLARYSEDEVRYVLNFGRPGSPMAAWGTPGGGPLTTQQVDNIVIYLRTIQQQSIDPITIDLAAGDDNELRANMQADADNITQAVRDEVARSIEDGEFETVGEAVFNLGLFSGYAGGGVSCARCHTSGWSLGAVTSQAVLEEGVAGCGGGNPSGIGYNLCGGAVLDRFPDDT